MEQKYVVVLRNEIGFNEAKLELVIEDIETKEEVITVKRWCFNNNEDPNMFDLYAITKDACHYEFKRTSQKPVTMFECNDLLSRIYMTAKTYSEIEEAMSGADEICVKIEEWLKPIHFKVCYYIDSEKILVLDAIRISDGTVIKTEKIRNLNKNQIAELLNMVLGSDGMSIGHYPARFSTAKAVSRFLRGINYIAQGMIAIYQLRKNESVNITETISYTESDSVLRLREDGALVLVKLGGTSRSNDYLDKKDDLINYIKNNKTDANLEETLQDYASLICGDDYAISSKNKLEVVNATENYTKMYNTQDPMEISKRRSDLHEIVNDYKKMITIGNTLYYSKRRR